MTGTPAMMRALWCLPAPAVALDWAARPFGIERRLPAGRNEVVLTFDDGPHVNGTPAVLSGLAAANVPATFFLVGEQVDREPALAAEIAAAGHEIALHGYRHVLLLRRRFNAMGGRLARRLCPHAVVVPPRMSAYSEASKALYAVFEDASPLVEGLSIDEAFIDVRGMERIAGTPTEIAARLRRAVRERVGIPVTVGIARTKFLAKVASAAAKPDGLLAVEPERELAFLHPLPIERVWGIGPATAARLRDRGIRTVGELARVPEPALSATLGRAAGRHLHALADNHDPRPVRTGVRRRSLGSQHAFGRAHRTEDVDADLAALVDRVARRLRGAHRVGRTVVLRLRFDDFARATRSQTLPHPTARTKTILDAARHVLAREGWDVERDGLAGSPPIRVVVGAKRHVTLDRALRLLGIGASSIVVVSADDQGRMRVSELPDLTGGPTIVCGKAGEVNTGSFDDLAAIADAAEAAGAWFHVDGAMGLWVGAVPHMRHLLRGVERADSWATDAHKFLNVPYDSGIAFCAHPDAHRAAMSVTASYLIHAKDPRMRDPVDWTPEFSRRARGFTTYAALRSLGRAGVAELVERCCAHARRFAELLADGGATILNDVVMNQVLVRFGDGERTREVIERVQADGTCWLGGTEWDGEHAMRISVSNWRTTDDDVERSAAAILEAARADRKVLTIPAPNEV